MLLAVIFCVILAFIYSSEPRNLFCIDLQKSKTEQTAEYRNDPLPESPLGVVTVTGAAVSYLKTRRLKDAAGGVHFNLQQAIRNKMVAQGKEPNKMRRLQAGSSEADNGFHTDVDVRAARHIGRQLAAIGDQLNRQLSDAHLAAWLPGGIGNLLARGAPYWVSPGVWRELNTVTTAIQGWLTELLCRQTTQTVERWRIWVSVQPSGGLVALILLVTAAAWSYF